MGAAGALRFSTRPAPRACCRVRPVCIASGSAKPVKVGLPLVPAGTKCGNRSPSTEGLCPENRGPTGTAEGEALDGQRDVTHHHLNDAGHVAFISDLPVDPRRLRSGPDRPASRPVARRAHVDKGSSAPAVAARTTSSTVTHGAPVLMHQSAWRTVRSSEWMPAR